MTDLRLDSTDLTWLAGLARALLGDRHAADDLVQETAMAALRARLPSGGARRPWLISVARRLAARRFRSDARREKREEHAARPEALPDSAELVERAEIAEQVNAAARRLPEPFRRTILLRFLEGLSSEEIARQEGKPTDTVRWRTRRGLELLREELVRSHDRDWSAWSVLLAPLARSSGGSGLAAAGVSGGLSGLVAFSTVMKTTLAVAAAVGCAGLWLLWESGRGTTGDPFAGDRSVPVAFVQEDPVSQTRDETAGVELAPTRIVARPSPSEETTPEVGLVQGVLVGKVVDDSGAPVVGARVYLVLAPTAEVGEGDEERVRSQTESDSRGGFQIALDEPGLDLGVAANGFRRKIVRDVTRERGSGALRVVLERGRTLSGRVVDETGLPVANLELLAYTAYAKIAHVSPSQRRLRSRRNELGDASSEYDHGQAVTDGRGVVEFAGLPDGDLQVVSLDAGWTIEQPAVVGGGEAYVEWIAKPRLGVRLRVFDQATGRPVDKAAATFLCELTFADGEVQPWGQWVGRGSGEVSFVLAGDAMLGLEDRTITRAVFHGTVRTGESERVSWSAEAIENPNGAVGVAEVRVEVDSRGSAAELATLELDVRYADAAPFEGELVVGWGSRVDSARQGQVRAQPMGIGRYRAEVPAGELTLSVADRGASGSLPAWTGDVRTHTERAAMAFVILPRGADATIARPDGWNGEWFVQASWRPRGTEAWQGSLGYSTDEPSMTLAALRAAEWRFELSRPSAQQGGPLVRTVFLDEGASALVDESHAQLGGRAP